MCRHKQTSNWESCEQVHYTVLPDVLVDLCLGTIIVLRGIIAGKILAVIWCGYLNIKERRKHFCICANKLLFVCGSEQFRWICSFKIYNNLTEELIAVNISCLHNMLLKISIFLIQNLQNFVKKWEFVNIFILYSLALTTSWNWVFQIFKIVRAHSVNLYVRHNQHKFCTVFKMLMVHHQVKH